MWFHSRPSPTLTHGAEMPTELIAAGTCIETSLDAARTSACATWMLELVDFRG